MRNLRKGFVRGLLAAVPIATIASSLAAATQAQGDPSSPGQASPAPTSSHASGAPGSGEIVVTATRRSEALSRVPVSVAAYGQAQLDTQNVRRVDDIARLTPSLTFQRSPTINANNSNVALRGIVSSIGAATTGVYIDDTPIQVRLAGNTATNPYPLIFDLDRVEVLRGPQGTLFGASSEGGSIRFITPKPNYDRLSIYARSEVSSIDGGGWNYEGGVAVGAPIVKDKIAFRASAWYRHDGGWVDRVPELTGTLTARDPVDTTKVDKDINHQNAKAFKLDIGFKPTDTLTITPSFYYQDQHINDPALFFLTPSGISDVDKRDYNTPLQQPRNVRDRFMLPSLLVDWDVGGVSVISNTSYFDRKLLSGADLTLVNSESFGSGKPWTTIPGQVATGNYINRQKNFSQEVRIQSNGDHRLSWVVGGFYQRAKQVQFQTINDSYVDEELQERGLGGLLGRYKSGLVDGNAFFLTNINTIDTQLSGFAQVDYKLTDKLKVTAGARISHTKFSTDVLRDGPLSGGRGVTTGKESENPVTPKFGISYQLDPRTLLYASASKGFRPGGAQAQLSPVACAADLKTLGLSETPVTFKSDSLWSYEVGAKTRVSNIVQVDAAGYVIKWKNLQQSVFLGSCGGQYIANIGSVTSQGFEVSTTIRPVEDLTLSLSAGYTDASFDHTVYTVAPNILKTKGSKLQVPPITLAISGEYEFDVDRSTRGYARFDYQYVSSTPRSPATDYNYDPITNVFPQSSNLDLRVGARFDHVDVSVFSTNVLNSNSIPIGRTFVGSQLLLGTAPRPRTIGLTASYRM